MSALREALAYTLEDAAAICGVSKRSIQRAIDNGELTRRYPHRYPVLLAADLREWLEALPTEPPGK